MREGRKREEFARACGIQGRKSSVHREKYRSPGRADQAHGRRESPCWTKSEKNSGKTSEFPESGAQKGVVVSNNYIEGLVTR